MIDKALLQASGCLKLLLRLFYIKRSQFAN
jgi:hypothetical protein